MRKNNLRKKIEIKIGIICEGQTDFHAIKFFFGSALEEINIIAKFVDLQPTMDKTQAEAGWGNIEAWLKKNPPRHRIKRYLSGGVFEDDLDAKSCDIFLLQMDSDIIEDEKFTKRILSVYGKDIEKSTDSKIRGKIIYEILSMWARLDECTIRENSLHIVSPAVESTETWCIASYRNTKENLEEIRGSDLKKKFMDTLHLSEGRAMQDFLNVDKNVERRKSFCHRHANGFKHIISQCPHFDQSIRDIIGAINEHVKI